MNTKGIQTNSYITSSHGLSVGDKVQVKQGSIDVINGTIAKFGSIYVEGSKVYGTIENIVQKYSTNGKFNLPAVITSVQVGDGKGTIYRTVNIENIAPNVVKVSDLSNLNNPVLFNDGIVKIKTNDINVILKQITGLADGSTLKGIYTAASDKIKSAVKEVETSWNTIAQLLFGGGNKNNTAKELSNIGKNIGEVNDLKALDGVEKQNYEGAIPVNISSNLGMSSMLNNNETEKASVLSSLKILSGVGSLIGNTSGQQISGFSDGSKIISQEVRSSIMAGFTTLQESTIISDEDKKSIGNPSGLMVVSQINKTKWSTVIEGKDKDKIYNKDTSWIQNANGFPALDSSILASENKVSRYDYQIRLDDERYKSNNKNNNHSFEDLLMKFRKSIGHQIHNNINISRAFKYFLYNRFKMVDINMAYNRDITHVFFTRPDLNLLYYKGGINQQAQNFSDSALIWKRNPNLFRLLTDCERTGETNPNNFNLLLSSQVKNISFKDEQINKLEYGKTWKEYKILYGGNYAGRGAGEFNCTFTELKDMSIINLIHLWMCYIDNVALGTWKPSYNLKRENRSQAAFKDELTASHIYTRTLDYASSCYVFKCAPDGEEILYWTKYYGIIPITLGLNGLDWSVGESGKGLDVPVTFGYSFKKDCSPISLLEFNRVAKISNSNTIDSTPTYINDKEGEHYSVPYSGHGYPFVGTPFICVQEPGKITDSGSISGFVRNVENGDSQYKILLKFKNVPKDDSITDEAVYRTSYKSSKLQNTNKISSTEVVNEMANKN